MVSATSESSGPTQPTGNIPTIFHRRGLKWYSPTALIGGAVLLLMTVLSVYEFATGNTLYKAMALCMLLFFGYVFKQLLTGPHGAKEIEIDGSTLTVRRYDGPESTFFLPNSVRGLQLTQRGPVLFLAIGDEQFGLAPQDYSESDQLTKLLDKLLPVSPNPSEPTKPLNFSEISKRSTKPINLDPKRCAIAFVGLIAGYAVIFPITSLVHSNQELFFKVLSYANILVFLMLVLGWARKNPIATPLTDKQVQRSGLLGKWFFIAVLLAGLPFCLKQTKNEFLLLNRGVTTQGTVIQERMCSNADGEHSCIDYKFVVRDKVGATKTYGGVRDTWHPTIGSNPAGSSIPVIYVQNNPAISLALPDSQEKGRYYGGLFLNACLLTALFFLIRSLRRSS